MTTNFDYILTTTLEGFISLVPSGKFNNCRIGFTLKQDEFDLFEAEYKRQTEEEASKLSGRIGYDLQPWGEDGCIKYSYGNPDPGPEDSKKPNFLWVAGPDNLPFDLTTPVREGSQVQLAIRLRGYTFGQKVGLSLRIRAGKVLSTVGFSEAPQPVTVKEANDLFGVGPVLPGPDSDGLPF